MPQGRIARCRGRGAVADPVRSMIRLNQKISPIQISNLGCTNLAVQTMDSSPEKLKAFFDFDPILKIDSSNDNSIWQKISPEKIHHFSPHSEVVSLCRH